MPTLQQQEEPIDQEIANALIEATPEWWMSAVMAIEFGAKPGGVEGYRHVISSPEGHRDLVEPTERIYGATIQLADLFRQHGRPWKSAKYTVKKHAEANWSYTVDFQYEDDLH